MLVIDNFFPSDIIDPVVCQSNQYQWSFCRSDSNGDNYWTIFVYGSHYSKKHKELSETKFKFQEVENCWGFIKSKFKGIITEQNLESCYLNGITYGVEAHAHVDSLEAKNFVTIICYICESWNSHWSGETCFYSMNYSADPADKVYYSHEIIKSVLPRYNRVVMFDGNVVHSVRPLSKNFKGLRKTLMFKLKNISVGNLEQNAT